MINYLIKAAMLDRSVYYIFKQSPEMVINSLVTVSITGLSIAAAMKYTTPESELTEYSLMIMVAFSTVLVGWMMWSYLAKVICQILGTESEFRDMMRSIGIAYSPGILSIFITIPIAGSYILLIIWIWVLLSVTRSIQSTQNLSFIKSLIPGLVGWFMAWILFPFLMLGNYFIA
tara:strand:+ start:228 stop:749 length:522 start_codon:yes stop_codon:yes gene_type:complete